MVPENEYANILQVDEPAEPKEQPKPCGGCGGKK